MDEPDLRQELIADGLSPEQADATLSYLAENTPATAVFGPGSLFGHDLAELRQRAEAGNSTSEDVLRLLAEVERLSSVISWSVHEPGVRAALREARKRREG
ncbi:MAG: hypothetical protein AAGC46_16190 [Solirubrobacteraceae bacterium]|nr:hypothetical protein [Patulibacter sp.]